MNEHKCKMNISRFALSPVCCNKPAHWWVRRFGKWEAACGHHAKVTKHNMRKRVPITEPKPEEP